MTTGPDYIDTSTPLDYSQVVDFPIDYPDTIQEYTSDVLLGYDDIDLDLASLGDVNPTMSDENNITPVGIDESSGSSLLNVPDNISIDIANANFITGLDGTQRVDIKVYFDDVIGASDYDIEVQQLA
jgi:hypothetical protein